MTKSRHQKRSRQQSQGTKPLPAGEQYPETATGFSARLVLAGIALLVMIQLLASFVPGIHSWGFDYWSELPWPLRFLPALLPIVTLLPAVAAAIDRAVSGIVEKRAAKYVALIVAAALFIVFRSRGHAYGDGYSFLGYFLGGKLPDLSGQLGTQVLDVITHWALYRYIVMPLDGTVAAAYAITGTIAGIAGLLAIVRIAALLYRERGARYLTIAAALTSGAAVLWFGYVESYALTNAVLLWALAFAIEAQRRPRMIRPAWLLWLLAVAFHQLAVAMLPAMAWAHWRIRHHGQRSPDHATSAALFGAGFLLWALATFVYNRIGSPVFVPVVSTADSVYTVFSTAHLTDVINLVLFLAPLSILGLIGWLWQRKTPAPPSRHGLIAVAAAAALLFSIWVDPLIGAFRDWDLLAVFGIPLSLWAGSILARNHAKNHSPSWLWVPVAAFGLVHVLGFVLTLQNERAVALRVDRLVRQDVHYSGGFFAGTRLAPWAAIIGRRLGRYDLAKDHLQKYVNLNPGDALAWANLGNAYQKLNMADSAAVDYENALQLDSTNAKFANNLGILYIGLNNTRGAIAALERAVALSDTAYGSRAMLGLLYLKAGMVDSAKATLDEAIRLDPRRFTAYYHRGQVHEFSADTAAAIADYTAAVAHGADIENVYSRLVQLYQWSGRVDQALDVATLWEQRFPGSANASFLAGTCYVIKQKYDSANVFFRRSFVRAPNRAITAYYLATTYRNMGQPDRARQMALRAIELDSNLAMPYLELVYLAADAGDRKAAVAATHEYLRRSPRDSGMTYLRQFLEL